MLSLREFFLVFLALEFTNKRPKKTPCNSVANYQNTFQRQKPTTTSVLISFIVLCVVVCVCNSQLSFLCLCSSLGEKLSRETLGQCISSDGPFLFHCIFLDLLDGRSLLDKRFVLYLVDQRGFLFLANIIPICTSNRK